MDSGNSASRRPVVLLHGFAQHPDSWNEVADKLLACGFEAVAVDLSRLALQLARKGEPEGGSVSLQEDDRSTDPFDAACRHVAHVVRSVFERTGAAPVLVGYSLGGRIALGTALCDESLPLAGLVLESAGLGPADQAQRETLRQRNAAWAQRVRSEGVETFMEWWATLPLFATQASLPAPIREALRAGRANNDPEGVALQLEGWGQHAQAGKSTALAFLAHAAKRFPIMYLAGALDAKYAALAEEVSVAAPDAQVCVVSDVGHNIHLEAPSAYVEELKKVLA